MSVGRVETLVALDYGRNLGLQELLRRLGDAVVSVESTQVPDACKPEVIRDRHAIRFDTGLLRNTEAHGIGFHCGFVVHVEP